MVKNTLKVFIKNFLDAFEIPEKYEKVENIRFSSNSKELSSFVVTCANGILFGQWVRQTLKDLKKLKTTKN